MPITPLALMLTTVAVVGGLLLLSRWLLRDGTDRPHHDTAEAIFSMVGVLYAADAWRNDGTGPPTNAGGPVPVLSRLRRRSNLSIDCDP